MQVTAIFDIGKTHKKFLLFDESFNIIAEEARRIPEIVDDEGFACDDLTAITTWIKEQIRSTQEAGQYTITKINFSTYGASLVHLDEHGEPLTPLYNYLKPIPDEVKASFYAKHGDPSEIAAQTSSPELGFLNSGLQMYWLKYSKPDVYAQIDRTLHFPNYLAYLLHGQKVCEYTSIGCHTALWNFQHADYHAWVKDEGINDKFPEVVDTRTTYTSADTPDVEIGVGIHDSSAALIPYILQSPKQFVLLSTGTWNITMNPFNHEPLDVEGLNRDSLHYFSFGGDPVKANRLFLGNEHDRCNTMISSHFGKDKLYHRGISFDESLVMKLMAKKGCAEPFDLTAYYSYTDSLAPLGDDLSFEDFDTYEEAYTDMVIKLAACQAQSIMYAVEGSNIEDIFVTGGFIDNEIFIRLLAKHFVDKRVYATSIQQASALGAALVMSPQSHDYYHNIFTAEKVW
ncbi:MAG: FGGY family carbohydrate kinase [Bacteroidota bacterium]